MDDFTARLEKLEISRKRITVENVKSELEDPASERRAPFRAPTESDFFQILTGETDETLKIGIIIPVEVKPQAGSKDPTKARRSGMYVMLDSGLPGTIDDADMPRGGPAPPGQTLLAKVLEIDKGRFSVRLSAHESDVAEDKEARVVKKASYYDYRAESQDEEDAKNRQRMRHAKSFARNLGNRIDFKNISFDEAERELAEAEVGEYLFRPSSKGADHLTVSWKAGPGFVQHVDILESGRGHNRAIGDKLTIDGEVFEDLDEIAANYIEPMAGFAKDLVSHRKFKHVPEDQLSKTSSPPLAGWLTK